MTKILLVEDNPLNQDMLSRRLTRQGYQVVSATDGAVALSMAKSEKPDLILMDMNIPIIDGWEATRRLKADDLTQLIPVVALTAHAMVGDREKALAAGCNDYATKPVEFKPLLKMIRSFTAAADSADSVDGQSDESLERRSRFNSTPLVEPFSAQPKANSSMSQLDSRRSSAASKEPLQARSVVQTVVQNSSQNISQNSSQNGPQDGQPDNPFTLLLVNDNAVNRQILNAHLQRRGYSVIEADDPGTAVAIIKDFSIDLVLLDITVPENANLALLQQLRSQYSKQVLPVVIVSSHSSDEEIVQAFDLGVNDYATKPINLAIIMARIQSQLETLQAARQAVSVPDSIQADVVRAASLSASSTIDSEKVDSEKVDSEKTDLKKVDSQRQERNLEPENPEPETSDLEKSKLENLTLERDKPIVTGALDLTSRKLNSTSQATRQHSDRLEEKEQTSVSQIAEKTETAESSVGFRDRPYSINHIFSKTPFSRVKLVKNPSVGDGSLCLSETFSPNIQDDAVLEDFRAVLAVERSQLKEIAQHDRIADLLGFFKQDGEQAVAFGWLQAYTEGMLLSENLSVANSSASPQAVLQSMKEMLEALVPFHSKRLVHCSIQPQHFWRCANNGGLRLINLGLSQRLAVYLEMRSPEHHKGFNQEHSYMPIEQRIGQPELSSDVYSVGLISLQLLTGKNPSVLTNVLLSSDPLSQRLPLVPTSMLGLFSKLLAQDSQERYSSAMEALKGIGEVTL